MTLDSTSQESERTVSAIAESCAVWIWCAAAILAPVALGGTWVWGRLTLEAALAVAIVAWAASARRPLQFTLPPLVVAGLVLVQLVPLPDRILTLLAPVSAGAWKVALQGLPPACGTISVDPAATAVGMRRLLLGAATVAAVTDIGRQFSLRRRLAWSIAISALVIVCLGFAFPVDRQDRILLGFIDLKGPIRFWKTPVDEPLQTSGFGNPDQVTVAGMTYEADGWAVGDGFGSYICSNHFAGAVSLTLPVAVALWLSLTAARAVAIRFGIAAVVLVGGVWTTGIAAGSRAGAAGLVVSGIVLAALTAPLRWQRRLAGSAAVAIVGSVVAVLAVLIAFDPTPGFERRFPAAIQPHLADLLHDGRIQAARTALRMFRASPVLGTGLDTFGELQPRFEPRRARLYFAHNDYAQLLGETGLVGAAVAIMLALALARRFRDFLRRPATPARVLDAGPWAALAGIGVHSLFDWNLHVPANCFLACLAAGMAAGSSPGTPAAKALARLAATARATLAAACVSAALLLSRDAMTNASCRRLSSAVASARLVEQEGDPAKAAGLLRAALDAGRRVAAWDPANARLSALSAQAALHLAGTATDAVNETHHWLTRSLQMAAVTRGRAEPALVKPGVHSGQ